MLAHYQSTIGCGSCASNWLRRLFERHFLLPGRPVTACIAQVVIGLAIGCELVDMCFDSLIYWDVTLTDGDGVISGRKAAQPGYSLGSEAAIGAVRLLFCTITPC